mmetsp:Transcript_31089/g.88185  ORF Transcript_31089/g.88185 Transcript_31089/m.88185 type:complete len:228 (-) Transcript_31089:2243-2926(-)
MVARQEPRGEQAADLAKDIRDPRGCGVIEADKAHTHGDKGLGVDAVEVAGSGQQGSGLGRAVVCTKRVLHEEAEEVLALGPRRPTAVLHQVRRPLCGDEVLHEDLGTGLLHVPWIVSFNGRLPDWVLEPLRYCQLPWHILGLPRQLRPNLHSVPFDLLYFRPQRLRIVVNDQDLAGIVLPNGKSTVTVRCNVRDDKEKALVSLMEVVIYQLDDHMPVAVVAVLPHHL